MIKENEQQNGMAEIQELLSGSNAVIFIDVDKTIVDPSYQITDLSIVDAIRHAQEAGYLVGLHSDTPADGLREMTLKLGTKGPNIAELGGMIDFPSFEIRMPLIEGADQYFLDYKINFTAQIFRDYPGVGVVAHDPVRLKREGVRLPGAFKHAVLINNMRQVSFGVWIHALDSEGNLSFDPDFYKEITANLLVNEKKSPFVRPLIPDFNEDYAIAIMTPKGLNKTNSYQQLIDLVPNSENKPFYMIGDGPADFIDDPRVQTFAVGNAQDKLKEQAALVANSQYATGVVELIDHILSEQ